MGVKNVKITPKCSAFDISDAAVQYPNKIEVAKAQRMFTGGGTAAAEAVIPLRSSSGLRWIAGS